MWATELSIGPPLELMAQDCSTAGTGLYRPRRGGNYGRCMTVGERIRARRLLRGWSMRYAASRAGVSHATWSRIERGRQAADNRFMLAEIAGALECSTAELVGVAVPAADRETVAAQVAVHGIRQALVEADPRERSDRVAPPVAELTRALELVDNLRRDCDYGGAGRLLPELLRSLHAAAAGRTGPGRCGCSARPRSSRRRW